MNIFALLRYLGREFLLILSTSSSESALPRLIAKMEHLGVSRPVVGITVPTGYSFNLDGTAIYLTMASLFIAEAMDKPFSIGQQISLLVFMIIASKGAAGVSGAGLATLAGGLQSHRPDLVARRRLHRRHRPPDERGPRADELRRQRRSRRCSSARGSGRDRPQPVHRACWPATGPFDEASMIDDDDAAPTAVGAPARAAEPAYATTAANR